MENMSEGLVVCDFSGQVGVPEPGSDKDARL